MSHEQLNGVIAHNGTGSICIGFHTAGSQKVVCRQLFSQQKMLSSRHETTLRNLRDLYNNPLNHFRNLHYFMQDLSLRLASNMMEDIQSLKKCLNFRDPRSLCTILYEMTPTLIGEQAIHENFLLCLSDAITLMEISELARNPNLQQLPRTGLVELALSARGQALRNVIWGSPDAIEPLKAWFENPFQIETREIGIINSASFFWGSHWIIPLLQHNPPKRSGKSEKAAQLREIENANIPCTHPLLLFARETSDGVNFIGACLHSRHPNLDNKRHQVFTSTVVKIIGGGEEYKNYLLLNELLKKIIALTFNPKQTARLKATQTAMLQAVESNPSLREDMEQLLTTHFYGRDSVEECFRGSPYYQEIMQHLGSQQLVAEEVPTRTKGCGL